MLDTFYVCASTTMKRTSLMDVVPFVTKCCLMERQGACLEICHYYKCLLFNIPIFTIFHKTTEYNDVQTLYSEISNFEGVCTHF